MIGILAALVLAAPSIAAGPLCDLPKADRAFEQRQYQPALEAYEGALKACEGEERLRALYRAAESKSLLFRYAEAAQLLRGEKLPSDPLWRARFLILKAELARENLEQYGFAAPEDEEAGPEGEANDVTRRTQEQWRTEARVAFRGLWVLRDAMLARSIRDEDYFVELKDSDLQRVPTLWDFAVYRWADFLLAQLPEQAPRPPAARFLDRDFNRDVLDQDPPAVEAAALYENAALAAGDDRVAARELWKLARLLIPFEHSQAVELGDLDAARKSAIETLKSWRDTFTQPRPRAEAALQAARFSEALGRHADAVELCRGAESRWPSEDATRECARLRSEIELPRLELTARFAPPPGKGSLRLRSRNLKSVYLRVYRVSEERLRELHALEGYRNARLDHLRQINEKELAALLQGDPAQRWSVDPKPKAPYEFADTAADPPPLDEGLYVAAACSAAGCEPGRELVTAAIVNVTRLLLIGSAGPAGPEHRFIGEPGETSPVEAPTFHLYALDAGTGEPGADARIEAWHSEERREDRLELSTDENGVADSPMQVERAYPRGRSASLDPLARHGESLAYWAGPLYFSHSPEAPVQVGLELDRPIYRPGQQVQVKVTALLRLPRGYKTYDRNEPVELSVRDPNGQELHRATLKLNDMGSAVTRFTVPTGRLLGSYWISAQLRDFGYGFSGSAQFQVEEYKRPEFEVLVKESTGAWKLGERAVVTGEARYYFGGPVPQAHVSYVVNRERYIPWFCWWWRGRGGGSAVVSSGTAVTDGSGRFSFAFIPQAEEPAAAYPERFEVKVEARDAGGRTITGERGFTAGAKAYLFEITPGAGFFRAAKPAAVPIRLRNLNEHPVAGRGRFTLYRLAGAPPAEAPEPFWGGQFPETPSLEQLYSAVADGEAVRSGTLRFTEAAPAEAAFGKLPEGAYRLKVSADDPWGKTVEQSIVLLSVGEGRVSLPLPAIALPEHASYLPGETARFLIGSSLLKGITHVELWGGQYLLDRKVLKGGPQVFSLPVTADHKGGVTVRWFGASDFRVRSGQARVEVPWKDKELRAALKLPKAVKPGERARGVLDVRSSDGKPVAGEALVRVYDRSLEYYAKNAASWLGSLYPARPAPNGAQGSLWPPYAMQVGVREGWIEKMMEAFRVSTRRLQPPGLRLSRARVHRRFSKFDMMEESGGLAGGGGMPMAAAVRGASLAAPAGARMDAEDKAMPQSPSERKKEAAAPPAVQARSDFSETAFFEPQLKVRSGAGRFSFKAPERLTDWRADAAVLTRDVKRGTSATTFVTRKELMVRVEIPRFYREGDEGRLTAVVHNETDAPLSGEVWMSLEEDGKPAGERFGLAGAERAFKAPAHGVASFSWPVKAPRGTGTFVVKAIARSGQLVDAEERELPLLPSRERLIESALVALDGKTRKTIELAGYAAPDPTRQNESMTLQVDPQLALSVINSLPLLVRYPYECTEQVLHRYVPLAIVNAFYRKNPKLADAVRKIPKRKTISPAWDRKDPRRLMSLMETPWEEQSKGVTPGLPIIDLFDARLVDEQKADALQTLMSYQLGDGGFPWFPGGRADPYMTLLVLGGYAEALRYGVDAPADSTRRALSYAYNEIPKHLKGETGELSLALYGAWVVTSFPKNYSAAARGWVQAKVWADFADKYGPALTPIGRATLSQVYNRLGERGKAEAYLDRAMDGAREDPIAGVYWQPEKLSWLWYNDNVETHAFILRTLLAVRPKDRRIPGMVQWLLFNRKGNEWKSTKASAAAIYSLLDVMRQRGALEQGERFVIRWGSDVQTAQVGAMDWLAEPIRHVRLGADVSPRSGKAIIDKDGPGLSFASLTWVYSTDKLPKASAPGMLELERRFFKREGKEGAGPGAFKLTALNSGDPVAVGDQVEVHLVVSARSQFEYVHLKDPRGAGFEAEELTSGWKWDQLGRYEEPRDSLTNFFMSWLPQGEYTLRYRIRPTTPGRYRVGAAVLQSMYAPEMAAHSAGFEMLVTD